MSKDNRFVLSKEEYILNGWKNIILPSGWSLCWGSELNIVYNKNKSVVLIGDVWQADPNRRTPQDIVENIAANNLIEDILEQECTWCGKYVLIINDKIYLDTAGMIGVYYTDGYISNNLEIICKIKGIKYKKPQIYHSIFPDFIPGPNTEYPEIRRVLPSGILDYVKCNIDNRKLLLNDYGHHLTEELNELLTKYYTTSLRNMKKLYGNSEIWLALTGGRDSRTTLAMIEASGIEYKAFTLEHNDISAGDVNIPQQLMDKIKKEWKYLRRKKYKYEKDKLKDFERHTYGMAVDEDRLFYAYSQYDEILDDKHSVIILRSSIYECVIDYFAHYLKDGEEFNAKNLAKVFPILKINKTYYNMLEKWFDYVNEDDCNKEISLPNRFLWDLRSGVWLSNNEQSYDIYDKIISVQPANCRRFLEILFAYDANDRKEKKHQENLIKLICPIISDVPYEGKENTKRGTGIIAKMVHKLDKVKWMIKNYGLKNTYKYFTHK